VACAAVAAFLPGDAITLVLETVPLYVLYEASILLASFVGRSADTSRQGSGHRAGEPPPSSADTTEPSVQNMIDHVDRELSD
jgi:hypothetical protein